MGRAEGPFNTNLSEQVYDSYQLPQSNVLQLANAQTYKGDTDSWATAITRAQAAATALGLGIYVPKAGGGPSLSLLTLDNGGAVYNVKAAQYGAKGDGVTDDSAAILAAVAAAIAAGGGTVYFPQGTYLLAQVIHNATAGTVVVLRGAGTRATVLQATQNFQNNGMVGYASNTTNGKFVVEDMTLDGNSSGHGGTIANSTGALVALYAPGQNPNGALAQANDYHQFNRVRFYRPSGYGFQPSNGVQLTDCEFDQMGASGRDNLGGGDYSDAIVVGCKWYNSTGNFVDFVGTNFCRLVMVGCESFNHTTGGVYGFGTGSIVVGNSLGNASNTGSYVGYDAATATAMRNNNVCHSNSLVNITCGGASPGSSGDIQGPNAGNLVNPTWIQVVAPGTGGLVAVQNIAAAGGTLRVTASIRSQRAAQTDVLALRVNADAGNNYDTVATDQVGGVVTPGTGRATGTGFLGGCLVPGASATAGNVAVVELTIPNFADTSVEKIIHYKVSYIDAATAAADYNIEQGAVTWRSTSAIGEIDLITLNANMDVLSTINVYAL